MRLVANVLSFHTYAVAAATAAGWRKHLFSGQEPKLHTKKHRNKTQAEKQYLFRHII